MNDLTKRNLTEGKADERIHHLYGRVLRLQAGLYLQSLVRAEPNDRERARPVLSKVHRAANVVRKNKGMPPLEIHPQAYEPLAEEEMP